MGMADQVTANFPQSGIDRGIAIFLRWI